MAWSTPITDRTQTDVDYAMANQTSTLDLKGALNVSDVNRIINNIIYVRDLLLEYGYTVETLTSMTLLTESDLPYVTSVIGVIKSNIKKVVNAFYTSNNPVLKEGDVLDYTEVNNMELNISYTNTLLQNMISAIIRCGAYTCGQTFNL